MKFLIFILTITTLLFSEKIEISSSEIKTKNLKKELQFIGRAKVKKEKDWIEADKIIVYFNDNNKTKKYVAIGRVLFEFRNSKRYLKGRANRVTYYPKQSLYILRGKATINDILNKRYLRGDKITLDTNSNDFHIIGKKKKPVIFTFELEEKK